MRVILILATSWVLLLSVLFFAADKYAVRYYYKHAWGQAPLKDKYASAIWVDTTKKASP